MNNKTVCILLADGFEEVEAIYPADIFKRLGLNVMLVGVDNNIVRGAHDIKIETPYLLKEISFADFDALMLPGGLPGTINLRANKDVIDLVRQADAHNKVVAAICAAPIILHDAGIAEHKKTTGYPSCEQLANKKDFKFSGEMVEVDGNTITAIGMGQAAPFAFSIAKALGVVENDIQNTAKNAFIHLS